MLWYVLCRGTILSVLARRFLITDNWRHRYSEKFQHLSLSARARRGREGDGSIPRKRIYIPQRRIIVETSDAGMEARSWNWNNKNCGVYAAQYRRIYRDVKAVASIFPYNMPRESFSMARALTSVFSPIYPSWNVTARVLWQSNTVVFKMAGFTRVTGCVVDGPPLSALPRLLIDNACDSVATPLSLSLSLVSPRGLG